MCVPSRGGNEYTDRATAEPVLGSGSQEKKSPRPPLSSEKRGSQGWGRVSLAVCLWRSRRGVARRSNSAAAPNTYSDSHGASPKGRRWVGSGYPTGPDTHSFPRSRPFKAAGSSPKGCPVCGGSGCGADVEVSSPVARGRGACERNASASQLVESPAVPCGLMDRSKDRSPLHVSPSVLATGLFQSRTHIASSPQRVFCLCILAHCPLSSDKGRIGGPSKRLAARDTTSNAFLGLGVYL